VSDHSDDKQDFIISFVGDSPSPHPPARIRSAEEEASRKEVRRPPGDPIALVKFDGTAITEAGEVVKHNWFKNLELDSAQYSGIMLTPEEAQKVKAAHNRMKTGATSGSIMLCWGDKICPVSSSCPLAQAQRAIDQAGEKRSVMPIGLRCPVETSLLYEWVQRYAEEFGLDDSPGNYTDQRIILELAECEVLEHRMNLVLSDKYQDLTEEKVVMVIEDETGTKEQHIKDVADAMRVKEKLWARKEKLRKQLVATRFDQYKREAALNENIKSDNSNLQSELMSRLKRLEHLARG
jgi:hypothetical protein